jgi:hypothetical protein
MPALERDRKGLVLILCDLATSHCHLTFAVILPQQHHAAWLGETENGNLKQLLGPYRTAVRIRVKNTQIAESRADEDQSPKSCTE